MARGASWSRLFADFLAAPEAASDGPFRSLRGGMGSLVAALRQRLPRGCLRTNCRVSRIERHSGVWQLSVEGEEKIEADWLIIAAPAWAMAPAFSDEGIVSCLKQISFASTATVFLALAESELSRPLDGIGFIVPPGEARLMAGTWVSSKWEDRAPAGSALVRGFVGGARGAVDVEAHSDEELIEIVSAELRRLMGPFGKPLFSQVFRYAKANPQPILGHNLRLSELNGRAESLGRLSFVGAGYGGVGIPDCVRQARQAAARVAKFQTSG